MPSNTVRVGIIGCGGIAFAKHLPYLSQIDGVEITGFYNPTEEKARKAKEQYGSRDAKIYHSWQDILPCIRCHDGCMGRTFFGKPLSCAVNPACGRGESMVFAKQMSLKMLSS